MVTIDRVVMKSNRIIMPEQLKQWTLDQFNRNLIGYRTKRLLSKSIHIIYKYEWITRN